MNLTARQKKAVNAAMAKAAGKKINVTVQGTEGWCRITAKEARYLLECYAEAVETGHARFEDTPSGEVYFDIQETDSWNTDADGFYKEQ